MSRSESKFDAHPLHDVTLGSAAESRRCSSGLRTPPTMPLNVCSPFAADVNRDRPVAINDGAGNLQLEVI